MLILGGSKRARSAPVQFIASKLGLTLRCVDLATVVSKYIGETEKNLRRLFDAAEDGGDILLFFRGGYAMHQGYVPPFAASHGCIRLPKGIARTFYENAPVATPVKVAE